MTLITAQAKRRSLFLGRESECEREREREREGGRERREGTKGEGQESRRMPVKQGCHGQSKSWNLEELESQKENNRQALLTRPASRKTRDT
ncbi:hypothetical protein LX36DRAFT_657372 [Colletotrichum falcatum]|nr:hypothetical protein LX36DRAFT_657372 [Colletotrichum falcatum]